MSPADKIPMPIFNPPKFHTTRFFQKLYRRWKENRGDGKSKRSAILLQTPEYKKAYLEWRIEQLLELHDNINPYVNDESDWKMSEFNSRVEKSIKKTQEQISRLEGE